MNTWIAGGALGAMARHGIGVAASRIMGTPVPYATAAVNLLGCFAIGALAGS